MATTVSDKDIYRTANNLIEEHGDGAEFQAVMQERDRRERGDEASAAVWGRVIKAIRLLQANEPEGGERVH